MIKEYAADLASQMSIPLSSVSVVEGQDVGCLDVHLMNLASGDRLVRALIFKPELDNLTSGFPCDQLERRIRTALSKLMLKADS